MLRWKKEEGLTGLARIGAGPRGSTLRDGEKRYAGVNAIGGGWRGPVTGWFWTCPSDAVGEYKNTCKEPVPDEKTAKAQAMAFVKEKLKVFNVI
ncbi:MAG: hypothetical protein HZC43_06240 [Nitrosomonadales bacterium]|nr:hypothetical protein [Nitrosomonadales bacterium]